MNCFLLLRSMVLKNLFSKKAILISLIFPLQVVGETTSILNGRVMDPASGMNKVANVLIKDGRITAISSKNFRADRVIDASGLVVAPGFIDLHAHGQDAVSNRFQAGDGVTTALELEIGVYPVAPWYKQRQGKAVLNYGTSSGHPLARAATLDAASGDALTSAAYKPLGEEQRLLLLELIREGANDGGIGIGMGITYTPAADRREILSVFELAADLGRPVFVHMRSEKFSNGDRLGPLQEVLSNAMITGASLHVVHINSSMGDDAQTALSMIRRARKQGVDVTSENYPYTAGSTRIESALFDDWTDYGVLQWVATGERLTKESFDFYRKTGGWVIIHGRSETQNAWLIEQPDLIIASDGIPFVDGLSHPRSAGTYSKILGRYVRIEQRLTLMQALAKMTIMPARRLEAFVPAMQKKGRLQVGMDADITIFNPETIIDRATYTKPAQYSDGIEFVLVNGVPVVDQGSVLGDVFPGKAIRAASGT